MRRIGARTTGLAPQLERGLPVRHGRGDSPRLAVHQLDRTAVWLRSGVNRVTPLLARAADFVARRRLWTVFGYARNDDYAREHLGRSGRWLRDLAALGTAIEESPQLADALTGDDGERPIGRVAAIIVARAADADSMNEWIGAARGLTVAELRQRARQSRRESKARRLESTADPPKKNAPSEECRWRRVRIPVPEALRAGFDEVLALSRSIAGSETTVTAFISSLVAESLSGADPPDVESSAITGGPRRADVEELLRKATDRWSELESADTAIPEIDAAMEVLQRLGQTAAEIGRGDAVDLDRQMRALIELEDELQFSLGQTLEALRRQGAWATLMFDGVGHYAEQRLGICRRTAEQRARLARLAEARPALGDAYRCGRVGYEAALLVGKALGGSPGDPELEAEWVSRAECSSVKRLKDELRVLGRGRWTGEDTADGRPLDDLQWQRSLLQAPGTIHDRVAHLALEAARLPEAGVFLSLRLPEPLAEDFLHAIEHRRASIQRQVDTVPWDQPWPDQESAPSVLTARLFLARGRRVPAWVGLLGLLEEFVSTWDDVHGPPRRRADKIYSRDGWRCTAPGCTSRRNIEEHHVTYRSQGGDNAEDNRIAICRFHHQLGEHGAFASCSGKAPLGITWRLGREDVAQWYRNECRIAIEEDRHKAG